MTQAPTDETSALFGGPLTYHQFRKLYPATRNLQRYTSGERADRAASHLLGHRQRESVGEYFYTHPLRPGVALPSAGLATEQAYEVYLAQFAPPDMAARVTPTGATAVARVAAGPALDFGGLRLSTRPDAQPVTTTEDLEALFLRQLPDADGRRVRVSFEIVVGADEVCEDLEGAGTGRRRRRSAEPGQGAEEKTEE